MWKGFFNSHNIYLILKGCSLLQSEAGHSAEIQKIHTDFFLINCVVYLDWQQL